MFEKRSMTNYGPSQSSGGMTNMMNYDAIPQQYRPQNRPSYQGQGFGGGSTFNVKTGITPGPVWNNSQVHNATNAMRQTQARPMPAAYNQSQGPYRSQLQGNLRQLVSQQANDTASDFNRDAFKANQNQISAGQLAQANNAQGWANLGLQNYATNLNGQLGQQGILLNFLRQLMGGF